MTEASRVQKMLTEQNEWIDRLKSQIMRLELDVVGYRVRTTQLEAALRGVIAIADRDCPEFRFARKALEGKDG